MMVEVTKSKWFPLVSRSPTDLVLSSRTVWILAKARPSKRAASPIEDNEDEDDNVKEAKPTLVEGKGKQRAAEKKPAGKSAIQKV